MSPSDLSPAGSPKVSFSPQSMKVRARNELVEYIVSVRSLMHDVQTLRPGSEDDFATNNGLPPLAMSAVDDVLLGVEEYIAMAAEEATENAERISEVFAQLRIEMDACGVSLYMEVRAADARKKYLAALTSLDAWLASTRWKTGTEQPLPDEFERNLMDDVVAVEKEWAQREDSISAPAVEFTSRTRALLELRNAEYERRQKDELIAGIRDSLGDGLVQRRKQLMKHVANRATMLRHTPKDNLSVRQRRDLKDVATQVLDWLDSHDSCSAEELFAQLCRVNKTAMTVSAAADIVNRRNELEQLIAEIRSSITCKPDVMDSLGEDNIEGIAFVLDKTQAWLEEHPNPTIMTLERFIDSLRMSVYRYGLSCVVDPSSAPSPAKGEAPAMSPASRAKLLAIDVACAMIEQLQVLRVACASAGAQSFIARRIAPLQVEVADVLADRSTHRDGAAELLRQYKAVVKAVVPEVGIRAPSSCWTQVLQLVEPESED
jgi:hypothetical protein